MSVISERTFANNGGRRRSLNGRTYRPGAPMLSSNRSAIGGGVDSRHFLLPQQQFSAGTHEGPQKSSTMDDRWENTTVLTGATSEHSYNGGGGEPDQQHNHSIAPFAPLPGQSFGQMALRRCSSLLWLCFAFLISFLALISAPLMVALPHAIGQLDLMVDAEWTKGVCEIECQGQILNLCGKTALLFLALYVLFWRPAAPDMPRLFLHRTAFAFFVFFVLFSFWLFYIVRILLERSSPHAYILSFSLSLVDILLFIHCIWIFFELRQFRPLYSVQIVRDPDGEWRTHMLGQMSIQEAAVWLLYFYRANFPLYNARLARRSSSALGRFRSIPLPTGFKLYDIDGRAEGTAALSEMNARILMQAASQRQMNGHNELFHDECDWDRRYRKRKCRLISCAEDIFAQVQAIEEGTTAKNTKSGQSQIVEPMEPQMAAKAILSSISKQLNRFLRFARIDHFHPHAHIQSHLQRCLDYGFSARTFLQRFFSNAPPQQDFHSSESKWSILCDRRVSGPLGHDLSFVLRCHDQPGFDRGVQLLCTVSAFPFLNLTEQSSPRKSFQLKVLPGNLAAPVGDFSV